MVELPSYYHTSLIVFILMFKLIMWLKEPYYFLVRLFNKISRWLDDDDDHKGSGGLPPNSGNSKGQRRLHTSAVTQKGEKRKTDSFESLPFVDEFVLIARNKRPVYNSELFEGYPSIDKPGFYFQDYLLEAYAEFLKLIETNKPSKMILLFMPLLACLNLLFIAFIPVMVVLLLVTEVVKYLFPVGIRTLNLLIRSYTKRVFELLDFVQVFRPEKNEKV